MNKTRLAVLAIILTVIAALIGVGSMTSANATGNDEPCVPSEAWTEVIEHPEVSHVVYHPAVTHEETVIDQEAVPAVWANFAPNDTKATFVGPALWPNDERGTWIVHNQLPPGHEGPDGVYAKGDPAKGGNWFYRQAAVEEVSHVIVVVDQEAWDEVVIDEEAWTEYIEHPEVTCEGEQPDPVVETASTSSYACGDDFETVTTVTTTTEYVLVEGEWVLGEPVVGEPVVTQNPVDVVECEEEPEEPTDPVDPQEPNTPVVNNPPAPQQPAAVPTVIDAGL